MGKVFREKGLKKYAEINGYYLDSIAQDFMENRENNMTYILSEGEETANILDKMGITPKKGIQVIKNRKLLYTGLNPEDLKHLNLDGNTKLVFCPNDDGTVFKGFSEILKKVKKENILLLITPTRLESMKGSPFIVKTGDKSLNKKLSGYYKVTTSYKREAIYNAVQGK